MKPKPDELEEFHILMCEERRLMRDMNTFLSNCAYSSKEQTEQLQRLERIATPKDEMDLVVEVWNIRREKGKKAFEKLQAYVKKQKRMVENGGKG